MNKSIKSLIEVKHHKSNGLVDTLTSNFILDCYNSNINLISKEFEFLGNNEIMFNFVKENFNKDLIISVDNNIQFVYHEDILIIFSSTSKIIKVNVKGSYENVTKIGKMISEKLTEVINHIEWVYNKYGESINIPIVDHNIPVSEMYPFLNCDLNTYYNNFYNSTSNILILIGAPGTGKTSFIRGYLSTMKVSGIVTYNQDILEEDDVFSNFMSGDAECFIIEDADLFLKSRESGNNMMHKFLNIGDGLVTMQDKKLIFSTNLPSINDIDSALLRPGRCFDIVQFRSLNDEEAKVLSDKTNANYTNFKGSQTIAEIFNQTVSSNRKVKNFGFINK